MKYSLLKNGGEPINKKLKIF